MNIMTKFGEKVNRATYQHMCDTVEDLQNIPEREITLGSIAIVVNGEDGLTAYLADSKKKWVKV